jgi:hypothetical protein
VKGDPARQAVSDVAGYAPEAYSAKAGPVVVLGRLVYGSNPGRLNAPRCVDEFPVQALGNGRRGWFWMRLPFR